VTDGIPHSSPDSILAKVATEYPIEEVISHVLGMRSPGTGGQPAEERLRAIVNANWLVELTAKIRNPADVAEFAISLDLREEHDLAAHALEVASASRKPADLTLLAAGLDGQDLAGMLLRAVIRRRLPQDVAAVLCELADADQGEMADEVLAGLAEARDTRDVVHVVIGLRAQQRDDLAIKVSRSMATQLHPAELARFVLGLQVHADHKNATHAIEAALRRGTGQAADLIRHLFDGDKEFADSVVDKAVNLFKPADKLLLASLLEEGLPPPIAADIWARIIPGLEDKTIVEAFGTFIQQAGPSGMDSALREAAKAHSIKRIGALVLQVNAEIEGGVDAIFDTVVRCRSIEEIDQLVGQLRDAAWTELAWRLLDLVIERVHERDNVGDAATLIHLLLIRMETERRSTPGRGDMRRWRQEIPKIITRIAQRRDPGHLMGLVDGLVRYGRYREYRDSCEEAVAAEYSVAELSLLPQVRGFELLPVVLEIMCKPLGHPGRVSPTEVPALISALRKAGARDDYLGRLMEFTGYRRGLDYSEIIAALKQAELSDEADAVLTGHVKRLKGRRVKPPRFFG